MSENPFYRLAPFIQEHIYRHKWQKLADIQLQGIEAILDTSHHVIFSSPTASGKTEAALFPIITSLYENPPATIGAMYIGPLKALINDQFVRLEAILSESDIPLQSWHGDVSQSKKTRFLRRAQGILQITPESLESMLINRHHDIGRLFADLRFVIIDEIHALINSDRGRQVLCQLERLEQVQTTPARRIGLSATIGEPQRVMEWLAGNSGTPVQLIESSGTSRAIQLGVEYFLLQADETDDNATDTDSEPETAENESDSVMSMADLAHLLENTTVLYQHIHQMTQQVLKTLIFTNRRDATEHLIINLRQLSEKANLPDFYHVHHGSISAALRETAEKAMRDPNRRACTAATVTLELGIDIGKLDQVLQVDATHSVSSFVQRLGRSGRRDNEPSKIFFYATEEEKDDTYHIGEEISWNFLQTLAIIQLYLEEQWVEPPSIPQMPLSLLYHQTMSIVKSHTELSPPQLARRVLTLSPFQQITEDHYRQLLRHLIDIDHLEQTDSGGLIIGYAAEKIVNNYRFYATFEDNTDYQVRDKSREIGTIQSIPPLESTFGLAGYAWRVESVDYDADVIYVSRVRGKPSMLWTGGGVEIHTRIVQKIREILVSDTMYRYLQKRARKRLMLVRQQIRRADLLNHSVVELAPGRLLIVPWCGSRSFHTLLLSLTRAGIAIKQHYAPYWLEVTVPGEKKSAVQIVQKAANSDDISIQELIAMVNQQELYRHKYDEFVPETLLREAYTRDYIQLSGEWILN